MTRTGSDTAALATVPAGWEGILDPGERILWQGRPVPGIVWKPLHFMTMGFGLMFAGFALVWMIMAAQGPPGFWMFGLGHFSIGLGIAFGPPLWGAYKRARTWYTLTDRRAFIATDLPVFGRRLQSWPIDEDTVLEFEDDEPGSIWFATRRVRTKSGTRTVKIGFERVSGARDLFSLIRKVQRGAL